MADYARPLALVTGASTGIGYELAKTCTENGFDLVIAADEPKIEQAAQDFRKLGAQVDAVEADLATLEGVDKLYAMAKRLNRPIDALIANAGRGLGKGFLDQNFDDVMRVINKDDPADVARQGFKAMMAGEGDVVTGWHNKLRSAIALVTPSGMLAEQHRRAAEPGSAHR